jgi:hypothetical protein
VVDLQEIGCGGADLLYIKSVVVEMALGTV